jgi:type IV pilus assembly protein PilW
LVELLVAAALGIVIVGTSALLYQAQRKASTQAADTASMHDAGMAALLMIGQQIEMAGFMPVEEAGVAFSESVPLGIESSVVCSTGALANDNGSSSCPPTLAGSHDIVVRYVDDGLSTWVSRASLQSTDCLGQGVGTSSGPALIVNRFYVAVSEAGQPELYCQGNGGGKPQPLVGGIERLDIRYWMLGATASVQAPSMPAAGAWSDVVAVDVCVLVRGAQTASRHRYVGCDGTTMSSPDGHARQAFSRRVAIRNQERAG